MTVALDKKVPDFKAASTGGEIRLSALKGSIVVLYFYPKDNTPGCTTEGADFAASHAKFKRAGAIVLGSITRQRQVARRIQSEDGIPVRTDLRSRRVACALFGVMKMKNMYGKQVRGIERSTFVIDGAGVLRREWRGVKVPNHVDDVLAFVQSIA